MVSRKHRQVQNAKLVPHQEHFTLWKLSIGVVSVLLGVTFMVYQGEEVLADTTAEPGQPIASSDTDQSALAGQTVTLSAPTADAGTTTNEPASTEPTALATQPAAPVPAVMRAATATDSSERNNKLAQQHGYTSADNHGSNIYQGQDGNWYKVVYKNGENKVYKQADITASANKGLPDSFVRENLVINREDLGNEKSHWVVVFFPNKGISTNRSAEEVQNAKFALLLTKDYQITSNVTITIDQDLSKNRYDAYATDRNDSGIGIHVNEHEVQNFNPKTDLDGMGLVTSASLKPAQENEYLQGGYYLTTDQFKSRRDIENVFFYNDKMASDKGSDGYKYNGNDRSIYGNNDMWIRGGDVQGGQQGDKLINDNFFADSDFNSYVGAFSSLAFGTAISLKSWGPGAGPGTAITPSTLLSGLNLIPSTATMIRPRTRKTPGAILMAAISMPNMVPSSPEF